jgi:uncharacterized protein (DUF885 family)
METSRPPRNVLLPSLLLSLFLSAGTLGLGACRAIDETIDPTPPGELDLWSDSTAGIENRELKRIVGNAWENWLEAHPFEATLLGDPRFGDEMPWPNQLRLHRRHSQLIETRAILGQVPLDELNAADRITWQTLDRELAGELASLDLDLASWLVDPISGPHLAIFALAERQSVRTRVDRERFVRRFSQTDSWLRQCGERLLLGKNKGRISSFTAVRKTIDQIDDLLRIHPMDTPMVKAATGGGIWVELPPGGSVSEIAHRHLGDARSQHLLRIVNRHLQDGERLLVGTRVLLPAADDPLSPEERGEFLHATLLAVEENVLPGLTGYRTLLSRRILSTTRSDERPGISHLPGGDELYAILIGECTSLPPSECDPRAIHDFGLSEVARIGEELAERGAELLGARGLAEIRTRLHTDPEMHFGTSDEVIVRASEALFRARTRLSPFFGRQPRTDCEVVPLPPHAEELPSAVGYDPLDAVGFRPGRYFVNPSTPEMQPRYEAEARAFHESIPGRHLQAAIQEEREDLPRFRRHRGSEAFRCGWALYAERLSDEMGLYSSDLDRLGLLSSGLRRAGLLVIDTGLHGHGWSREQAVQYLRENTLLTPDEVESDVDHTLARPGEALSYKIGEREILRLRHRAEKRLGSAFSLRTFHDRILENGAVPLPVLREVIARWLGDPVPETGSGG